VRSKDGDAQLGGRGLSQARAGVTARAVGVVEWRRSVPIGERWRFVGVGRNLPTTHARACVASSLRCESDRRLRVRTPAQAVRRVCVRECGRGCRVKTRGRGGASSSTYWGHGRRRRVAPASAGFCYPDEQARAVTRSRGDEGVHTLRPIHTVHYTGRRRLSARGFPVSSCSRTD